THRFLLDDPYLKSLIKSKHQILLKATFNDHHSMNSKPSKISIQLDLPINAADHIAVYSLQQQHPSVNTRISEDNLDS
ncbi:hypothetical protein M8C21_023457, partial [Ambrosia artemisiifolia]